MFVTSRIAKDALGVAALAVAVALVGRYCYARLMVPEAPRDPVHTAQADFRDVIYYPTRAVLARVNPYDSSENNPDSYRGRFPVGNNFPVYSPLIFAPALPFAVLPLWTSVALWWLINLGLTVVLAYVAWRWCGAIPSIAMTTTLAAAILISRPGLANIYFGQATLFFVLASLAALHWARSRPYLSALALAIATIKPTFGGPLAVLMFCRRDWKAAGLGSFAGIAAAAIGLAIVFSSKSDGKSPLAILRDNQQATESDPAVNPALSGSRIDAAMVVERLVGPTAGQVVHAAIPLLILATAGVILWRASSKQSLKESKFTNFDTSSSALILVTAAGCIYHNIYDGLLLVVPAVLASPRSAKHPLMLKRWQRMALCALLLVPAISYFSSRQFQEFLQAQIPAIAAESSFSFLLPLANGSCVLGAWLLLLVATARTSATSNDHQPSEAAAKTTIEFSASPPIKAGERLVSHVQAAPLPMLSVHQQGVRP